MTSRPTVLALPDGWDVERGNRFSRAVAAIDAVNEQDPNQVEIDGVVRPKEVVHAEQMTAWVLRLDPEATDEQLLAARAHHLRRWALPRHSFPAGRAGYLRWRSTLRRRQAAEAEELLRAAGYDDDAVATVGRIVGKEGLGTDPAVQTHEDALCLVFITLQFEELAAKTEHDRMVEVVRKTLAKMSAQGRAEAASLPVADSTARIIGEASAQP